MNVTGVQTCALPICEAEALIAQKNNGAYEQAVRQLQKVKSLHLSLGQSVEWSATLARLRAAHKPPANHSSACGPTAPITWK